MLRLILPFDQICAHVVGRVVFVRRPSLGATPSFAPPTRANAIAGPCKASFSARAVGAYAVAVAGDAAYGEEAQGHFESVDPLLLGDGGDGDDDDGVGKAVVTSMVDRGIRELSDAVTRAY